MQGCVVGSSVLQCDVVSAVKMEAGGIYLTRRAQGSAVREGSVVWWSRRERGAGERL